MEPSNRPTPTQRSAASSRSIPPSTQETSSMRFARAISFGLLLLALVSAHAQNKTNPRTQILWPTCTAGQQYQPFSNSCVTTTSATVAWPNCAAGEAYVPYSNSCATISTGTGMPPGWVSTGTGPSQVTTAPGTVAVGATVLLGDGQGEVNARAKGLKCDGTTDDTGALN